MKGFLGGLRERLKWWAAPAEMRRLESWRSTVREYRQWIGGLEFPDVGLVLTNLVSAAEGHGLNAGTPGNESSGPWNVQGLREFLRRRHVNDAPPMTLPCAARAQGTAGGNVAADCDWPFCGCDPHADRVIAALQECGVLNDRRPFGAASGIGYCGSDEPVSAASFTGDDWPDEKKPGFDQALPGTDRTIFGYPRPRLPLPMPTLAPLGLRKAIRTVIERGLRSGAVARAPASPGCWWPECGCSSNERRWNKGCVQGLGVPPKPAAPPAAKRAPDEESNVSPHLAVLNPRCAAWPGCACAWNQPCVNLSPAPS